MSGLDDILAAPPAHPFPGQRLRFVPRIDERAYEHELTEEREPVMDLGEATVYTSEVVPEPVNLTTLTLDDLLAPEPAVTEHKPVLDIDLPVKVFDSTTPGHHHLVIDKAMPWSDYAKLLNVLAEVGVVEDGYVRAALSRGYTAVRLPWVKKKEGVDGE